jgi:hypothetical protein
LKGYFEAGGVEGAIARTADRLYESADAEERDLMRSLLLRMTELGEGAADTRRRVALAELLPPGGLGARAREILRRLDEEELLLPSGDRLTSRRFRQLGMWLGDSAGFESLHHVLELPFGSSAFLHDIESAVRFGRNPIYATLHESSYADGVATRWSAARLLPDEIASEGLFTAEHVYPWMWEDYAGLRGHRAAADLLAEHPWPRLYDADQLRHNDVPVAATIYVNDLYVERAFAEETAAAVRGLRPWITDEYEHNGLRADGERVLGRLIDLARGRT